MPFPLLRIAIPALIAALALMAASGCSQPESEPLRVGFIATLSGRGAELGQTGRNGVLLAIEQLNQRGGIDGRRLELVTADTHETAEETRAAFKELAAQGVAVMIGPMLSQTATALKREADQAHVVLLAPTVSTPELSGQDDHFYRIYPTVDLTAPALADYALARSGVRSFTIVFDTDNASFTRAWVETFSAQVTSGGGRILATVPFSSRGKPSMLELAEAVVQPNPEGVLILASSIDTGNLVQHIRSRQPQVRLFGSEWSTSGDLPAYGGQALAGMEFIATSDQTGEAASLSTFRTLYRQRFNAPANFAALFGYEAMQVLGMALRKSPDGQLDKATMDRLGPVDVLGGTIQFDANGEVTRDVYVVRWEQGYRTVERIAGRRTGNR